MTTGGRTIRILATGTVNRRAVFAQTLVVVAARTGGFVGGETVRHHLRITGVASKARPASQIAMVAGIVRRQMAEARNGHAKPVDEALMAVVAGTTSDKVPRVLTSRLSPVVTCRAGARHYSQVIELGRTPRDGGMAGIARLRRGQMRRCLTSSFLSVVTGSTSALHYTGVVKTGRQPSGGLVAVATAATRRNMQRVLALSRGAVVATEASA